MLDTKLSILRHGEVKGGAIFRGSQDDPLTDKGWQQLQDRLALDNSLYDMVLSSPLIRCAKFAKKYSILNKLPLTIMPAFKEIDFGDWEGKSYTQINETTPELLKKFYNNPQEHPAPNGEALIAFQDRILEAITKVTNTYRGKNILLITHGGVQKIIIAQALKMPLDAFHHIETPYACLTKLSIYHTEDYVFWLLRQHA